MYYVFKISTLLFVALLIIALSIFCTKKKVSTKITLSLILIGFLFSGVLLTFLNYSNLPEFELKGESDITLEVFDEYVEPGFVAGRNSEDLSEDVVVDSNVDNQHIGEYTVKYELNYLYHKLTKQRTVCVVDTTPPEIVISGVSDSDIVYSQSDIDAIKATATDKYDGDLTSKIEKQEMRNGNSIVCDYFVTDASGNTAHVSRTLVAKNLGIPEITLKGYQSVTMLVDSEYVEDGASAVDSAKRDISGKLKVSGKVDTKKQGVYKIVYSVEDSQGNVATALRTVNVVDSMEIAENKVYLTFDDGPSVNVTSSILDTLKENNVYATFFLINYEQAEEPLVKRMADEGHTIAIHGYSHVYNKIYASEDAFMENVTKLSDKIYETTGQRPKIMRFPGGSSNKVSSFNPGIMTKLTKRVTAEGYKYFDWNVVSGDADDTTVSKAKIVRNVTSTIEKGRSNIVLMHDSSKKTTTAQALPEIIDYCKKNGYFLLNITDDTQPITHHVYN